MAKRCGTRNNPCPPRPRADWWVDFVNGGGGSAAPSVQASEIVIDNSLISQAEISWTNGNGGNRIVVVYPSAVYTAPTDGETYTANTAYGSGESLGLGYVVYSGAGSSVTVTGLTPGTTYYVKVFEANITLYNTSVATDNPVSFSALAFSTQYQAVLDRATTLGITKPSLAWQIRQDQLLRSWVIDGKWDDADKIYMLANDGSKEFGELEWKNPSTNRLTEVANGGALVWTSEQGTKSDGLAYYNAGFALTTLTQYQQNNAFIGMAFYGITGNSARFGGTRTITTRATLTPRNNSNGAVIILNSATAVTVNYTPVAGMNYFEAKRDGNDVTIKANGTTNTGSHASVGVPNTDYFVLAQNNNGTLTAGSQIIDPLAFIVIGNKNLDGIMEDVEDFFT